MGQQISYLTVIVVHEMHICWKLLSNQGHFKRFIELVVEQSPRVLTLQSTTIQLGVFGCCAKHASSTPWWITSNKIVI